MKIATKLTKKVAEFVNENLGFYFEIKDHDIYYHHVHYKKCYQRDYVMDDYIALSEQEFIDMVSNDLNKSFNPQPHYNNYKGSLYKIATDRNWNAYIFDVVKRLERGGKKDPLKQEIEKSIDVLKIWLNELPD